MKVFLLLLASIIPHGPPVIEDRFDFVEINTIRNESDGSVQLKQYIWWDMPPERDVAHGWLRYELIGRMPVRCGDHYELVWFDGKWWRRVISRRLIISETWGRDPEVENRKLIPLYYRRGLSVP